MSREGSARRIFAGPAPDDSCLPSLDPLPELPPCGFDPESESQARLSSLGFPLRPDKQRQPGQYAVWSACFNKGTRYLPVELTPIKDQRLFEDLTPSPSVESWMHSQNWSGFATVPNSGRILTGVTGRWRIPKVAPARDPCGGAAKGPWQLSTWVGLGGLRKYSRALPQIGTDVTLRSPADPAECRVWVQWYADPPSPPFQLAGFAPVEGSDFVGYVWLQTPFLVSFAIVQLGEGGAPPRAVLFRLRAPDGACQEAFRVLGDTAEWVLERPADLQDQAHLLPLPAFEPTTFDLVGVQNAAAATPGSERNLDSDAAFLQIEMYARCEAPDRTVTLVRPALAGRTGTLTFVGDGY